MAVDIRGRKMKKPPACVQCRKRKIGCDRVKPICSNCLRNGKNDCFYPDIPGVYVQSNTSSVSASVAPSQNVFQNSELSNLEQIREYNTRLQLLNAAAQRSNSSVAVEQPQFLPKISTSNNLKSSNGNGSEERFINLVQCPAIFDTAKVPYTQDEIFDKELKFLKVRLLELQKLTGTKFCDITLENDSKVIKHREECHDDKKRRVDNDQHIDEFKSLDPSFLNPTLVFEVIKKKSRFYHSSNSCLILNENIIFTPQHLSTRDDFLCQFHNKIFEIMSKKFPEKLSHQQLRMIPLDTSKNLKFPSKSLCLFWINYFHNKIDMSVLVPLVNIQELIQSVDQWFPQKDVKFIIDGISMDQVSTLGLISLYLLICYESLTSTVLIPFKLSEDLVNFKSLENAIPDLVKNVYSINQFVTSVGAKLSRNWKLKLLPFISIFQFYQFLTTHENNTIYQALNWAIDLGINHESSDKFLIVNWNFIYKTYCWQSFMSGKLPIDIPMLTPILDPILLQDFDFLNCLHDLLTYLHQRNETLNVKRVLHTLEVCQEKLNHASQHCSNNQLMVNHVVDTLIYRQAKLFINFYLLLHYESLQDSAKFNQIFRDLIQFLQETVFYIFSGLSNIMFAGYEFFFHNITFTLLRNTINIIFAISERTKCKRSVEFNQIHETLIVLFRKIGMLIIDYSKNCRKESIMVEKIKSMIIVMLETEFNEDKVYNDTSLTNNGFELMDSSTLNKNIAKLRTMSESLIKTEFYNKRSQFNPTNSSTYGISQDNFGKIYNSFYN